MHIGRFIVLAVAVACGAAGQAGNPATTNPAGGANRAHQLTVSPAESSFLKVTIDSSRSPITLGTEAGVSAEVKNVSGVAVRIYENEAVFTTMPETRLYGPSSSAILGCATFPTQGNVRPAARPARGYELLLQPGDSYRIFWDMTRNGCTAERLENQRFWSEPLTWLQEKWQRMMFVPGTYRVYLDLVLYPETNTLATAPRLNDTSQAGQLQPSSADGAYHTATEGRDVLVSASQQIILLGAFLGGLVAYLIKVYYGVGSALTTTMQETLAKRVIAGTEWLAAGLFGAAIVVLASRLSDTFPVKVNANDFWGSIALGFVFQWMGVQLLQRLPGMGSTPSPTAPAPQPGPAAAMQGSGQLGVVTGAAAVNP